MMKIRHQMCIEMCVDIALKLFLECDVSVDLT